jgi:hypothetical protein
MRYAPGFDEPQELAYIRPRHDDDAAAKRHDRQAQHARRMGQRREREIGRTPVERIAHKRERRHRFEVAAREHHALGLPRRAASARDHDDVVDRRDLDEIFTLAAQPFLQRRGEGGAVVEADERGELRQVRNHALDQRLIGAMEDQRAAVESVKHIAVLGSLVPRIDRTPDGARARQPENASEGDRMVAREHSDFLAGFDPRRLQRPRHAIGQLLDLRIGEVRLARREARRIRAERRALVEIVDQSHWRALVWCWSRGHPALCAVLPSALSGARKDDASGEDGFS